MTPSLGGKECAAKLTCGGHRSLKIIVDRVEKRDLLGHVDLGIVQRVVHGVVLLGLAMLGRYCAGPHACK